MVMMGKVAADLVIAVTVFRAATAEQNRNTKCQSQLGSNLHIILNDGTLVEALEGNS